MKLGISNAQIRTCATRSITCFRFRRAHHSLFIVRSTHTVRIIDNRRRTWNMYGAVFFSIPWPHKFYLVLSCADRLLSFASYRVVYVARARARTHSAGVWPDSGGGLFTWLYRQMQAKRIDIVVGLQPLAPLCAYICTHTLKPRVRYRVSI
jgi:hypothetical protein